MMQFLIIDFPQIICGCDYYIIRLLCGNYTSLHCSMLSTCYSLCDLILENQPNCHIWYFKKSQFQTLKPL